MLNTLKYTPRFMINLSNANGFVQEASIQCRVGRGKRGTGHREGRKDAQGREYAEGMRNDGTLRRTNEGVKPRKGERAGDQKGERPGKK